VLSVHGQVAGLSAYNNQLRATRVVFVSFVSPVVLGTPDGSAKGWLSHCVSDKAI
jgi:hypothetical protein